MMMMAMVLLGLQAMGARAMFEEEAGLFDWCGGCATAPAAAAVVAVALVAVE